MKHLVSASFALALGWSSLSAVHGASVNVALDAPAYANGTIFGSAYPALLVNGDKSAALHGATAISPGFAYWIDLRNTHAIDQIKIYPRQDGCCPDRLSNFHVSVHEDEFTDTVGFELWGGDFFTDGSNPGSAAGTVFAINAGMGAGTFAGRWVKITSLANPVPDYALQLAEIEVWAEGTELKNFGRGAAATADRPLYVGLPISMLTDGNRQAVFHGDTDPTPGFRYQIDMGVDVQIDHINLWSRQDGCCPDRLSNYRVTVHSESGGGVGPEVWGATLHGDGSNAGSGPGAKDTLRSGLHPGGVFAGRYVRIESQASPVPSYALQMTELEVWGTASPEIIVQITRQPQDAVTLPPRQAAFDVGVNVINGNRDLLRYQWQKNGVNIVDGTNSTYLTPPVTYAGSPTERYRCVVSYPGRPDTISTDAGIILNHALGAAAYANQPLYAGWPVSWIVDGNRLNVLHGDANLAPGFAYEIDLGGTVNLSSLVIYPRQDGCCPERLTKFRVSIHDDASGSAGAERWGADFFTDGTNPGSAAGGRVVATPELNPAGTFAGQWIRITSLENPVQDYALQMAEVEVFGTLPPGTHLTISRSPQNVVSAPYRSGSFSLEPRLINGDYAQLHYQWQRNGVDITGANASSYTPAPFHPSDEGVAYRAIVSYPGALPVTSSAGLVTFDYNYARGSAAFANQPLWVPGGWNIRMLTDGDRTSVFHGDTAIPPGFAYQIDMGLNVAISNIVIYPRQDTCCPDRFSNVRLTIHEDDHGTPGLIRWTADLLTGGANAGAGPGITLQVGPELDPFSSFSGRWVRIQSLADPVPNYALQLTELEVYGRAIALEFVHVGDQLELSWFTGVLEGAPNVTGPWTDVPGAVSPFQIPINPLSGPRFFRVRD
jgi:hypothetical protein